MEDSPLQAALDGWIAKNPGAEPCDFVVIFPDDLSVIGPFPSEEVADKKAFETRPKAAANICSIGGPHCSQEVLRARGSR